MNARGKKLPEGREMPCKYISNNNWEREIDSAIDTETEKQTERVRKKIRDKEWARETDRQTDIQRQTQMKIERKNEKERNTITGLNNYCSFYPSFCLWHLQCDSSQESKRPHHPFQLPVLWGRGGGASREEVDDHQVVVRWRLRSHTVRKLFDSCNIFKWRHIDRG